MIDTVDLFAPDDFQALGVQHQDDPGHWHILVAHDDIDLWLGVTTTTLLPQGFVLRDEDTDFAAKAVALLGMPWDFLEQDLRKFVDWQRDCLAHMRAHVQHALQVATLDEVRAWRGRVQERSGGELVRAMLTGDEPWVVSN